MATVPTVLNAAIDAVVARVVSDFGASAVACERVSRLIDAPEDWWAPGSWPTTARTTVAVIDGVTTTPDRPEVHDFERTQLHLAPVRIWTRSATDDRSALSADVLDDVRRVQNSIEAIGASTALETDGYHVDWEPPVRRLDVPANQPPYAARELQLRVYFYE